MPKNWLSNMCGVLRTDIWDIYRSIFGITRHPAKKSNFGHSVFSWLFDAEIRFEISCFVKNGAGEPEKAITLKWVDNARRKLFWTRNFFLRFLPVVKSSI